jgi:L-2-hydroxyglutarate oxidase LhgO
LGVHFTKKTTGAVEVGPNAVLAFAREGYRKTGFKLRDFAEQIGFSGFWRMAGRYWKTGMAEMYRSFSKAAFVKALQTLVPEIQSEDLAEGSSGVRAQAVDKHGKLIDDFYFVGDGRALHVCNVPSPAATASIPIASHIVEVAARDFGWAGER